MLDCWSVIAWSNTWATNHPWLSIESSWLFKVPGSLTVMENTVISSPASRGISSPKNTLNLSFFFPFLSWWWISGRFQQIFTKAFFFFCHSATTCSFPCIFPPTQLRKKEKNKTGAVFSPWTNHGGALENSYTSNHEEFLIGLFFGTWVFDRRETFSWTTWIKTTTSLDETNGCFQK